MTIVFEPLGTEEAELCQPVHAEDFELLRAAVDGLPKGNSWQPVEMKIITRDRRRKFKRSDAPWLCSDTMIFRTDVVQALGQVLLAHGELLPLRCSDADLFLFNCTSTVRALDEGASKVDRFPDGRIFNIDKYVFQPEALGGAWLFRLSALRVSPVYVTAEFVDAWAKAQLEGLRFVRLWP